MPQNEQLKDIEGVIWDLDNTLYRFEGDFEALCHVAAAKAALKGGLAISYEQAMEICLQSYEKHKHSYFLFIEEYKLDMARMHRDFHTFIDEKLLRAEQELIELFRCSKLQHVLVTHASAEWAGRALRHIGLKEFFPDERIIAAEHVDFARKSQSRIPFEKALRLMDVPQQKVAVVEDIAANLRIPSEMGLHSVLVHYGQPPDDIPEYVRFACNNAVEFMRVVEG